MVSQKSFNSLSILFLFVQFGVLTVSAMVGCAAEANFQACKAIEESTLSGCGPVDYACQCSAQKLIHQCYNLCPEYSIDANERSRIAQGICAAVPTTSIKLVLPSMASTYSGAAATTAAATQPPAASATSISQQQSKSAAVRTAVAWNNNYSIAISFFLAAVASLSWL